jgi:hypothetical protein
MNVSAVANGQYAAYQSGICNKTSSFNEVLQEHLQEPQKTSPQPSGQAITPNLKHLMMFDMSSGQPVLCKRRDVSAEDMELIAYAMQLEIELGLMKEKELTVDGGEMGPVKMKIWEHSNGSFLDALQELLDKGAISREDIINAVKCPPKIQLDESLNALGYKNPARNGSERYAVGFNLKDFETTEPIAFSSASELFEMLWGKKSALS